MMWISWKITYRPARSQTSSEGDVRTVQKLTKDGTLTCEKKKNKNLYNLYTVVREYCDYVAKLGKKKISSVEEEKALEEVRIKRAKAELAELEMQELKGKLHAAEDVEQMTSDLVMVIRSSLWRCLAGWRWSWLE